MSVLVFGPKLGLCKNSHDPITHEPLVSPTFEIDGQCFQPATLAHWLSTRHTVVSGERRGLRFRNGNPMTNLAFTLAERAEIFDLAHQADPAGENSDFLDLVVEGEEGEHEHGLPIGGAPPPIDPNRVRTDPDGLLADILAGANDEDNYRGYFLLTTLQMCAAVNTPRSLNLFRQILDEIELTDVEAYFDHAVANAMEPNDTAEDIQNNIRFLSWFIEYGPVPADVKIMDTSIDPVDDDDDGFAEDDGFACAVLCGDDEFAPVVESLLRKGADVNARAANGQTGLMIAARRGNVAVLRVLLAHNANGACRDEAGHDAMYFAAASGNQEVIVLVGQVTTGVRTRQQRR